MDRKPESYRIRRMPVNAKTIFTIPIARGGDRALRIIPAAQP